MKILSKSAADTIKIGRKIAKNLKKGDIICLFGDLGSGKTVLTKGIACGLGVSKERIISPSFILVRRYKGKAYPVYHFDLYRLRKPQDILVLGYEEYLYDEAVSVIEWADRLEYLLPGEFLKIELEVSGKNQRRIKFSSSGSRYRKIMDKIHEDLSA